jgi:hypothetical protein
MNIERNVGRQLKNVATLLGAAVVLTACNTSALSDTTGASQVALIKVESFAICPDNSRDSGVKLIDNAKAWQAFVDSATQRAPGLSEWKPNFATSRMVLVKLGSKPSAGYGVNAIDAKFKPAGDELVLTVQSTKPEPGSLNASVLTSPCLLANLAHTKFKTLSVFDLTEGKTVISRP